MKRIIAFLAMICIHLAVMGQGGVDYYDSNRFVQYLEINSKDKPTVAFWANIGYSSFLKRDSIERMVSQKLFHSNDSDYQSEFLNAVNRKRMEYGMKPDAKFKKKKESFEEAHMFKQLDHNGAEVFLNIDTLYSYRFLLLKDGRYSYKAAKIYATWADGKKKESISNILKINSDTISSGNGITNRGIALRDKRRNLAKTSTAPRTSPYVSEEVLKAKEPINTNGEVLKAKEVIADDFKDSIVLVDVVDEMPQFPEGIDSLFSYLSSSIRYPVIAEENGVEGRVILTFVVERDGTITDVKVVRSIDPSLDKEAVRVIKSMPKWIPGKNKGKPIRMQYTIPVTFRLNHEEALKAKEPINTNGEVLKAKEVIADDFKDSIVLVDVVDEMPQFPEGIDSLFSYLSSSIRYPVIAEENGVQGRVIVTFVVERDGSLTNIEVVKSVDPSLDKEAVRVAKSMPKWIPGKNKGEPVRVKYTLPVTFRLQ